MGERSVKEIEAELEKECPSSEAIRASYRILENKGKRLGEVDAQMEDIMIADESVTSQDWDKEQHMVDEYKKSLVVTEIKVNDYLKAKKIGHGITGEWDSAKTGQEGLAACKLPKISLAIYDGTFLDWLGWWSQFETIHENPGISEVDKFRYLVQSMKRGTRAERLVRSYPLTKENYPKVIKALKDRFGDSTILTEVYVRQLLKLVVNNVRRKGLSLESMYDQLESHLKSLESLGVNVQQKMPTSCMIIMVVRSRHLLLLIHISPVLCCDNIPRVDIEGRLASGNTGPRGPKISQTPPYRRVDRIVDAKGREENPKEPMESDPDSESGGSPTFPKKENTLGRTQEVPPGQEDVTPPPPVSDVLGSLARTIYQLSSATGLSRDVELSRYDGSYEAQSFFDNYDAQADLAQLHYTDRLRRLPNLLQGKALHYFRSLKLDKLYYVDARQALIDLFPETTNASFAQFLAIKLTDRSSLEEYYQKKTVCGLQLNLPHKILLESLTDGLPVADQRIVAAVQPNTLQAWYSVVSRVRGTHSASQVCQQTTRTTPNPSFAPSPRYSAPRPWSARPNYSANPPPSSCRYCGAMHWHAQCPKRPAQNRPRPVYRATTYPQHDRTVLSSPAPFQVNNTRAHVTRSPDPLYTTSPAQAVNPS
ncbi:hypothetical protein LAZ67_2002451 [Cordylochernes scorpioides]|uniref:Uncharacterized protein n=1 Tax=Cordylochernes scorpioides TaxID=51811 RepID=A0ABY6K3Q8_9ARAC|nr:hypothetical protein LAZ67_2002451 [Cordylochernes scorpioides]